MFLNAVLERTSRDRIRDISFSDIEAGGEHEEDKQSRLDLLVVTNADEWINVEIQFSNQYDMVNRSIYYWAGVYRKPMKRRMGYRELRPVIAINLLNFDVFSQSEKFHTTYHLYEDEEQFKLTDVMEFHFIEMTKLIQAWKEEKLNPWDNVLARWLLLLGIVDQRNGKFYDDIFKELEEIAMNDETLHSAFQSWEALSGSPGEVDAYQDRLKRVLDEEAAVREAELRKQEADILSREAEARKQEADVRYQEADLRAQEAERMKQEAKWHIPDAERRIENAERRVREAELTAQEKVMKSKVDIIQHLLASGMVIEKIAEATELDVEQVLKIQKQLSN